MNYRHVFSISRLRVISVAFLGLMFGTLLLVGRYTFREAPPLPARVIVEGPVALEPVFTAEDIHRGRDVWRRPGGMVLGSVWGHGSYLAPDWTVDVLHREALAMLNSDSRYDALPESAQVWRCAVLASEFRTNTYDPPTGTITISSRRKQAIDQLFVHYSGLLAGEGDSSEFEALRKDYAISDNPLGKVAGLDIWVLVAWWWWTTWAAGTQRPGIGNIPQSGTRTADRSLVQPESTVRLVHDSFLEQGRAERQAGHQIADSKS